MSWRSGWLIVVGSIAAWCLVLWLASCTVSARIGYDVTPAFPAASSASASE